MDFGWSSNMDYNKQLHLCNYVVFNKEQIMHWLIQEHYNHLSKQTKKYI